MRCLHCPVNTQNGVQNHDRPTVFAYQISHIEAITYNLIIVIFFILYYENILQKNILVFYLRIKII
jgi:hypothetical protein